MKKHKDLIAVLKSNEMRITPARRLLLQFILDNSSKQLSLKDVHDFMEENMPGVDRSSIYRNLEAFKKLDIIQELMLPKLGKRFQYVFDRKVHHFFICKACGKLNKGNKALFEKVESALKDVHGFSKANLSVVFYGYCSSCGKKTAQKEATRSAHGALSEAQQSMR
ncbi:MAG: transcriptional repressor [Deltaproteobacteria bacterium]|nr:transcriptional repressor [Deltaproteobacteria bacterium]